MLFRSPRYEAARKAGFVPETYSPEMQENLKKVMSRIPPDVVNYARTLAKIEGTPFNDMEAIPLQGMHWIKTAIDDKISEASRQGNSMLEGAYSRLKEDFLAQLEEMQPLYKTARESHAAEMRPINRMKVGKYLEDQFIPAGSGDIPERLN